MSWNGLESPEDPVVGELVKDGLGLSVGLGYGGRVKDCVSN
jgi:hypothetical protein